MGGIDDGSDFERENSNEGGELSEPTTINQWVSEYQRSK
jgi:hypothetical protein